MKPSSSRPIWIYFEFRSKPSLITVISMDPRPTNYLRQNIVFSYPKMIRVCFSLFLSLSVFCYFRLLLIFIKIILLWLLLLYLFIFMKIIFIFSCSGMFRNVPECSGMFRNVPCSGFYRRPVESRYGFCTLLLMSGTFRRPAGDFRRVFRHCRKWHSYKCKDF